jgi:hypothetical protein
VEQHVGEQRRTRGFQRALEVHEQLARPRRPAPRFVRRPDLLIAACRSRWHSSGALRRGLQPHRHHHRSTRPLARSTHSLS